MVKARSQLFALGVPLLLAGGPLQADQSVEFTRGQAIGLVCSSCHGTDGISFGRVPSLKGMSAEKIEAAMLAYRNDTSNIRLMDRIAKGYTTEEISIISDYFGSMR